MKKLKRDNS